LAPAATSSVTLEQQFVQPCDEPDWEGIQLKRTSKNTLGKQGPLLHNLEDGAGVNLLTLRLQLMKST